MSSGAEQDWHNIAGDWQAVGSDMQPLLGTAPPHTAGEVVPDSIVSGSPPSLSEVVTAENGLPLSCRTVAEIITDYETERAFTASSERSMDRRSFRKHEFRIVINLLDGLDERKKEVADMVIGDEEFPLMYALAARGVSPSSAKKYFERYS
jgi:hypothetical protein